MARKGPALFYPTQDQPLMTQGDRQMDPAVNTKQIMNDNSQFDQMANNLMDKTQKRDAAKAKAGDKNKKSKLGTLYPSIPQKDD